MTHSKIQRALSLVVAVSILIYLLMALFTEGAQNIAANFTYADWLIILGLTLLSEDVRSKK